MVSFKVCYSYALFFEASPDLANLENRSIIQWQDLLKQAKIGCGDSNEVLD